MIQSDEVVAGLAPVQEMIRLDGGDIQLVDVDGTTAHLRLVIEGANCAECVLPRQMLEGVALQMMQPLVPGLTAVAISDPRES